MTTTAAALLDTDEVAALCHVDAYTVREWAKSGALRGSKPGKRWLFEPADVDAFIESGENRPPNARETARRRRRRAA